MKLPSLPPLNALHVFAVAGRQLSFKRAAELLHVSPGAVSQQIKLLEDHLGCPLFIRRNRAIELTDEGSRLLLPLREAFQAMVDAVDEVSTVRAPHVLMVSVLPSFGALWLVPRLGKFRRLHPEVEVMINATPRLVALSQEHVDMAIRCGAGRYPGLHVDWLLPHESYPVCHPRLLKGRTALKHPEDLKHHTLLHDESQTFWAQWLKAHGVPGVSTKRGPVFSDANLALQAALDGQGVALITQALTESALTRGALVRPFDLPLNSSLAYYLVCEAGREQEPAIRAFRDWILAEAHRLLAGDASAKRSRTAAVSVRAPGERDTTQRRSHHARAS